MEAGGDFGDGDFCRFEQGADLFDFFGCELLVAVLGCDLEREQR